MSKVSFENSRAVLATMHKKERVIAPILEKGLGIKVVVPANFNTDIFGTFTREIDRVGTQLEAARLKAEKALETTGEKIAIASEGSFFSHPVFPYVSCNRELILLLDHQNQLEIVAQEISTETNYTYQVVKTVKEAIAFSEKVGFPEHALVVRFDRDRGDREIFKGITDLDTLIEQVESILKYSLTAQIETDMRAMYNPMRMKVIEKATQNLIEKINRTCPNCSFLGFDVVERIKGLPCAWCGLSTPSIRLEIYGCQQCQFKQEILFPNGIKAADPSQCINCNP